MFTMRVLIVDDDPDFRQEVCETLASRGCSVDEASCAAAGKQRIETGEYDMVLVDFKMPDHSGLWLMQHVDLPAGTKALLVTGHVNRRIIDAMFRAGVCGYLIKPFDEDDLMRHVRFHVAGEGTCPTEES